MTKDDFIYILKASGIFIFVMWFISIILLGIPEPSVPPQEPIDWLKGNHWTLQYSVTNDEVLGKTDYITKTITLYTKEVSTLYHEVGHAIGREAGFPQNAEYLYSIEGNNLTKHAAENSDEFFASAYSLYVTNANKLKQLCPKTYAYIRDCFFTVFPWDEEACHLFYQQEVANVT